MKKKSRIVSVFLSLALVFSMTDAPAYAADATDATDIPEYITTATIDGVEYFEFDSSEDLVWWSEHVAGNQESADDDGTFCTHNIILTADIDMAGISWTGVGNAQSGYGYSGVFDGNGHTISNLKIESTENTGPKGLLLNYAKDATVRNLTVQGSVTASSYAGGLVGRAIGSLTVEDVLADANVTLSNGNTNAVGGLIGQVGSGSYAATGAERISITNCAVFGEYTSETSETPVGGLIGGLNSGFATAIENCYVCAELACVSGEIAGLIAAQETESLTVKNCYYPDDPPMLALLGIDPGIVAATRSTAYMQSFAFLEELGAGFVMGAKGYPVPAGTVNEVAQVSGTGTKYPTLTEAIAAAGSGDTVILLKSCAENVAVPVGADIILDLNGFTLTGNVTNGGTLTIRDSAGGGAVTGAVINNGTLTITGGTYSCEVENYLGEGCTVVDNGNGTCTVTAPVASVTMNGTTTKYATLAAAVNTVTTRKTATVTLLGNAEEDITVSPVAIITLDLNGFTLTGNVTNNAGFLTIQDSAGGGAITGALINGGTLTITGGTFSSDVSDYVAEGYVAQYNEDFTWTVLYPKAQFDGRFYGSLAEAIVAAEAGGTVTPLKSFAESIAIPEGADITLDLNGCTLTGTVSNAGTLTIQDSSEEGGGVIRGEADYVIQNTGTLTIESGAVTALSGVAVRNSDGTLKITGGTFTAPAGVETVQSTGGTLSITGGTFSSDVGALVPLGYRAIDNNDGTWTVLLVNEAIVTCGETVIYYSYLTEALTAAEAGDIVTMLADVAVNITVPAGANLTLDLNGKTLTGTVSNAGILTIQDSSEDGGGAITGGKIGSGAAVSNSAGGILAITGGTVSCGDYAVKNEGGNMTITGGTFTSTSRVAVYQSAGTLNITGGTFTAPASVTTVLRAAGGTVTTTGGAYSHASVCLVENDAAWILPDGYEIVDNGDSFYRVMKPVVRIVKKISNVIEHYDSMADAIAAVGIYPATFTLLADFEESFTLPNSSILDLNGKRLTGTVTISGGIATIQDSAGGGIIDGGSGYALVNAGGINTIEGGTFLSTGDAAVKNSSILTINDGAFTSTGGAAVASSSTLTINGGVFTSTGTYAVTNAYALTINGGILTSESSCAVYTSGTNAQTTVWDGVLTAADTVEYVIECNEGSVAIKGGKFSKENICNLDQSEYLDDCYEIVDNGDGTWSPMVTIPDYIETTTKDGEEYLIFDSYEDMMWLKSHISNQEDGALCTHNIILYDDIDMRGSGCGLGSAQQQAGFSGIFDGGGHAIYNIYTGPALGPTGMFVHFTKNATIKNLILQGFIFAERYVGGVVGRVQGSLTLENIMVSCVLDAQVNSSNHAAGGLIGQIGASAGTADDIITIKDCAVIGTINGVTGMTHPVAGLIGEVMAGFTVNIENSYAAVTMTGGRQASIIGSQKTANLTIDGFYYLDSMPKTTLISSGDGLTVSEDAIQNVQSMSAENLKAKVDSEWEFTTDYSIFDWKDKTSSGMYMWGKTVESYLDGYPVPVSSDFTPQVAMINETGETYHRLADAIDHAELGDTISLIYKCAGDVTVPAGKDITLDLNGFTLSSTVTNEGTLTIQDKSETGAGTITASSPNSPTVFNNGGTLTITDGAIIADGVINAVINTGGTLTITGGSFRASGAASAVSLYKGTVAISGGTFTAGSEAPCVISAVDSTVQISGGIYSQETICSLEQADYLVPGYEIVAVGDGSGYYTVRPIGIAQILSQGSVLQTYADFQGAMNAVISGQTVQLLKDVQADTVAVDAGVTLDLNGQTLTAVCVVANGQIMDSKNGAGVLKVGTKTSDETGETIDCLTLQADNEQLPIYDSTAKGYRFVNFVFQSFAAQEGTAESVELWCRLLLDDAETYQYLTSGNEHGLKFSVKVSVSSMTEPLNFECADDVLSNYAERVMESNDPKAYVLYLKLTGLDGFSGATISGLPKLESTKALGFAVYAPVITYVVP